MKNIVLSFLSAIGSFVVGFALHTVCSKVCEKVESYFINKGFSKEQITNFILKVLALIVLTLIYDVLLFK